MNVVDLHPEDLLDKDARGELSDDERVRLATHLTRCAACRAERVLRADFAAELAGDDRPSSVHGLIQGVIAAELQDDAHPEDLLEKEVLSESERASLEEHLAGCAACRAERVLRADFAAELEDEAPVARFALVERALQGAKVGALETAEPAEGSAPRGRDLVPAELAAVQGIRRRSRRTAVVLLFAAAILAASAASATGLTSRVWFHLTGVSLDATHPERAPTTTSTNGARHGSSPGVAAAPPATVLASAPAAEIAAVEAAVEAPVAPLAAAPVAVTALPAAPAAVAPSPVSRVSAPPQVAVAPVASAAVQPAPVALTSASDLFDSANAARRSGDTAGALVRYEALESRFPGSREARVAKATSGRLLLDRGDPAAALARFDAYLASGSSELREEAMAGRATALERLGRDDDEVRAWAALLAAYPHTPYATHARGRIGRSLPR